MINNTPSCVDHHPPAAAMANRKWRRATKTTHKVDAPLPRPQSARLTQWKNTFNRLNLSLQDVTKADLDAPLLELQPLTNWGEPHKFSKAPVRQQARAKTAGAEAKDRILEEPNSPLGAESPSAAATELVSNPSTPLIAEQRELEQFVPHNGRPSEYCAGLTRAYLNAASNDNVRQLLQHKSPKKKRGPRPSTAMI